jgi:hypothetical protein
MERLASGWILARATAISPGTPGFSKLRSARGRRKAECKMRKAQPTKARGAKCPLKATFQAKATQSHLKATPKPVDSQPIATPKPLQSHLNATPKLPQSYPKAWGKPGSWEGHRRHIMLKTVSICQLCRHLQAFLARYRQHAPDTGPRRCCATSILIVPRRSRCHDRGRNRCG